MNILEKMNLKEAPLWKIVLLALAGLLALAIILSMAKASLFTVGTRNSQFTMSESGLSSGGMGMGLNYNAKSMDQAMPELSARNVAGIAPEMYGGTTGNTAENFEVTDYSATIETRALKQACAAIAGLKPLDYVIFENANEYDQGCNYYFKVKTGRKDEILDKIKDLDPRELAENTRTIKKQIDDFTGEQDILKKQLASVEDTLNNALSDYDKLRELATSARDVESLAKIIDSKINLIERLSQQRININAQLDRLSKAKADELDKVEYTFFSVNVYENKFVDWKTIKDSWKQAVKTFVYNINKVLQDISINLVTVVFVVVQWAIYLIVLLVAAKFLWKLAKRIWGNEKPKV